MAMSVHDYVPFAGSLAIGLLLGFERERHHGEARQAAGSRTFALLALLGTLAASFDSWAVVAGLLVTGGLLIVGYRRTSTEDPGLTTEFAAVLAYALGALAWQRSGLAAGLAIVVVAILASKARLHAFARDVITETELEDAIKFLVMAFVVLPLLPNRSVGPYGVLNPERIWQLVVALTGISWAGYIATRAFGARRGLLIAGLAGGFISASATTASMARLSRTPRRLNEAVSAASLASLATFAQLAGIIAVADRPLLERLWPSLLAGAALLLITTALMAHRGGATAPGDTDQLADDIDPGRAQAMSVGSSGERPFGLRPTLILASVLTLALLVGRWVVDVAGARATMIASGAAGLADAHAGALSAATLHDQGQVGMASALLGVGAALSTNTVVKCILAFAGGGRQFGLRFMIAVVPAFALFASVLGLTAAAQ